MGLRLYTVDVGAVCAVQTQLAASHPISTISNSFSTSAMCSLYGVPSLENAACIGPPVSLSLKCEPDLQYARLCVLQKESLSDCNTPQLREPDLLAVRLRLLPKESLSECSRISTNPSISFDYCDIHFLFFPCRVLHAWCVCRAVGTPRVFGPPASGC